MKELQIYYPGDSISKIKIILDADIVINETSDALIVKHCNEKEWIFENYSHFVIVEID